MDQGRVPVGRRFPALAEEGGGKAVDVEHRDAVMVDVIPLPPVRDGGLGGNGLDGGMAREGGHGRVEPRIGDAFDPDGPAAAGMVHQPFGRIIGVGRLVSIAPGSLRTLQGTDVDELALAQVGPADALEDDDIPVCGENGHPGGQGSADLLSVRGKPVRGPEEDKGMRIRVLRFIDGRMQADPVAHGNIGLSLDIVFFEPLSRDFPREGRRSDEQERKDEQKFLYRVHTYKYRK